MATMNTTRRGQRPAQPLKADSLAGRASAATPPAPEPAPSWMDRMRQLGLSNTATAVQGAGQNIAESYQAGGLPSAAGATVRNTMVPALGFADDVMGSAARAIDPAAQALKTFVTGDPAPINARSRGEAPAPQNAGRGAAPVSGQATQPAEQAAPQTAAERLAQRFGGITRSVDANTGRVTFSGEGPAVAGAQMTPAQRLEDMESSNDRLREIGLRSRELRDELSFNAGGALSRRIGPEERAQNMLSSSSRSDRQAALQYRLGQQQDATKRSELTATERMRQPQFLQSILDLETANRVAGLQRELVETRDPARRREITQLLQSLNGNRSANTQVVYAEEALDPARPEMGTRRVPMVLNQDGSGTPVTARGATRQLPQGISRDQALEAARRAIASGYDAQAVMGRLGEYGLTLEDIQQ